MIVIVTIFAIVYLGMLLGRLPGLKVDRAAIALLGAIALVASDEVSRASAIASVGFDTLALLFGLMIVSAQFTLAGFYEAVTHRVVSLHVSPQTLLAILVATAGMLSALLTNDVVALAMAPVLIQLCAARKLNPTPFLLALALSANAGATATIIGSPQAMLIGQHFNISFAAFSAYTAVPAVLSLLAAWVVLVAVYRNDWQLPEGVTTTSPPSHELDRVESVKGILVTATIIGLFVFTELPRDLVALAGGGILLMNAHFQSRKMLDLVDWQLLILFVGLFVVNGAFQQTHLPQEWIGDLKTYGFDLQHPAMLFLTTAVLSDTVSNVPAVMLLVHFAEGPIAGPAMALASGLASNLIIIGSLANIIVVDAAARHKLQISAWEFARVGIPITLVSLAIAGAWLWFMATIV